MTNYNLVLKVRQIDFITMSQVDLFSFVFWKKLKTWKRHFELHWPLLLNLKVHTFWEGHKILRNLQLFVLCTASQIIGGNFAKFFGLLIIYELYYQNNFSEPYGIASLPNFAAMVIVAVLWMEMVQLKTQGLRGWANFHPLILRTIRRTVGGSENPEGGTVCWYGVLRGHFLGIKMQYWNKCLSSFL